ncbi:MAG: hypothetical protein WCL39_01835 [Armatimonadota bacterium]
MLKQKNGVVLLKTYREYNAAGIAKNTSDTDTELDLHENMCIIPPKW